MGYLDLHLEEISLPQEHEIASDSQWYYESVPGIGISIRNEHMLQYSVYIDKRQLMRINALLYRKYKHKFAYEGLVGQALTGYQSVSSDRWHFETKQRTEFDALRQEISAEIRELMGQVMSPANEVDSKPRVWVQKLDMPAFADMEYHDLSAEYEEVKEAVTDQIAAAISEALPAMEPLAGTGRPQTVCIVVDANEKSIGFYRGQDGNNPDALIFKKELGKQVRLLAEIMKYLPARHRTYLEEFLPTQDDLLDEENDDPYHEIPGMIEETLSEYDCLIEELVFDSLPEDIPEVSGIEFWADIDSIYTTS